MLKKSLIIFFVVIIIGALGVLAYEKILRNPKGVNPFYTNINDISNNEYQTAIEIIKSDPTNSFGAVTLVDSNGNETYCNLTDADSCAYQYDESVSANLLAYPAEGFVFDKWVSGCDKIITTYQENDTCAVISYSGVRKAIVSFIKK